jgi:phage terminase large subunit-like protein
MQDNLDDFRATAIALGTPLKVVGVDPTVAEAPGDECGIVVCCATADRELYKRQAWVLEDASIKGSPEVWAQRVVNTARKWGAPVIAEKNQGGALVRNAIHQVDPGVPVFEVWSKQGKQLRAEPVSLAYEQGRVHHLGIFADLETQMTQWIPGETKKSPDRIDALVHALTALLITPPQGFGGGPIRAKSPAQHRIPISRGGGGRRGGSIFSAGRGRVA